MENNMKKPPDLKLVPINSLATAISPPKTASNNIVSQVKTAMDHPFKRADELKKFIDDPKSFEKGREWTPEEKSELKKAEADYDQIQSEKKKIEASLDGIDSLFNQKSQGFSQLSQYALDIESKIKVIDDHLSQYTDKLKSLEGKGDTKTDEEKKWESQANELVSTLKSEKNNLNSSLIEIQSLQLNLNKVEDTITEKLKALLGGGDPRPKGSSGPLSATAINLEMEEIKGNILRLSASISEIFATASKSFSSLFETIKNISSNIVSQLASATATLAESTALLSTYPASTMQPRM